MPGERGRKCGVCKCSVSGSRCNPPLYQAGPSVHLLAPRQVHGDAPSEEKIGINSRIKVRHAALIYFLLCPRMKKKIHRHLGLSLFHSGPPPAGSPPLPLGGPWSRSLLPLGSLGPYEIFSRLPSPSSFLIPLAYPAESRLSRRHSAPQKPP